jgi:hypothetical protein
MAVLESFLNTLNLDLSNFNLPERLAATALVRHKISDSYLNVLNTDQLCFEAIRRIGAKQGNVIAIAQAAPVKNSVIAKVLD